LPTWGDIINQLKEPENALANGRPDCDKIRRSYLAALHTLTGRPVIAYCTAFLEKDVPGGLASITLGDVQGFMNAVADVPGPNLDLVLTSPGGTAEATESIVSYLRTRFDNIRVFVPVAAMSAATMLALGADEIVMGAHSQLGPIDPQFNINTPDGPRSAPGQAILEQFEQAKKDCSDPKNIGAWMPILRSYLPGLLAVCHDQRDLAKRMVAEWLQNYMLRGDPDAPTKAAAAAEWFANYDYFGSHSRRVSLQDVLNLQLKAKALEDDPELQDAVLSVHHSYAVTFTFTSAIKIIENHLGKAYIKIAAEIFQAAPVLAPPLPLPPASTRPPQAPSLPRAERRRQNRGR
jgi:hypothetical protein